MSETTNTIPSIQDFCVFLPLYAEVTVTDELQDDLYSFITDAVGIDCFCVDCQQPSVFRSGQVPIGVDQLEFTLGDRIFTREFWCSRVHSHLAYFHFRLLDGVLSKIGQSPSMADISEEELRPYAKVLKQDEYRELTRAVGLASHGVGIGSFVYLRRIFERLIEEARAKAAQAAGWDEDAFQQVRMDEKIAVLKDHLPPFLVDQRKLYSILSKGIHSLTEKECIEAFPVVRVGTELILDQKVAANRQEHKMNAAKKQIAMLQQKLKNT
jgi:hypothetical protein